MRKFSIPSFETIELLSNHGLCVEDLFDLLKNYQTQKKQPELLSRWKQFITEDIQLDTPEIRAMLDFLGIKALWHQAGTKTA